jgi:very-short-patch-repair endonuclease
MDVAQNRLTQVFKFLKELNELRNPVPRDMSGYAEVFRLETWPLHPLIRVRRGDPVEEDDELSSAAELEPLIRIKRAPLTPCPNPPDSLDGWLKPGWQSVEAEAEVLAARNFPDKEKGTVTVAFEDNAARVLARDRWAVARSEWVAAELPAIEARQIFERIHALWTKMQREGDRVELVLAEGMLNVADCFICHPVLLQRVNLEFDPSGPEFCFHTGTEKPELYRALLRLVPSIEGRMVAQFDREMDAGAIEPLGGESTTGFLRRVVQGLFTDGEFSDDGARSPATGHPVIWRDAVILLRPRSAGLNTTLDFIVEDLEGGKAELPDGLVRIIGVEAGVTPPMQTSSALDKPQTPQGPEPDILFSKPSNAEQYAIAARLIKSKAVLVQGPPGTGKTHTIANLLGHLLMQGKTVLVTAHTTKALRVLRGLVDEALQPLCLSVLEGDAASQAQLSRSAQDIAARLSRSDAPTMRREAAFLREKRGKLRVFADSLRRQLRDARFSEVEEVVLGGEGLPPIEVAKRIKEGAETDGWIPAPLAEGFSCPLEDAEIRELYASNGILAPDDEIQLGCPQPVLSRLVAPSDFRLLANEQAGANSRAQAHRPELWGDAAGRALTSSHLRQLHQSVHDATKVLGEESTWLKEVLFAGWIGGDLRKSWEDLLATIGRLAVTAGAAHRLIVAHGPELPEDYITSDVAATLSEIISHLEGGGVLGLRTKVSRRGWHQLLDVCRVDGRPPRTLDELRALRARVQLAEDRKKFAAWWRRAVESLGGPAVEDLGASPERTANGYAEEITKRLEWRSAVWEPLIGALRVAGFRWDTWLAAHPPGSGDHGELARVQRAGSSGLAEIVEAQAALIRQGELSSALQQQRTYLAGFPQSDVASVLLHTQDDWDAPGYDEACRELARLEGLHKSYEIRVSFLGRLKRLASAWAHAIGQRQRPHDASEPPGDPTSAWRWRQWSQELEKRAAVSMTGLQEQLDKAQEELRRLAAQIIEQDTWAAQRERTGLHVQQALMGFVQTIRKIGAGKGKRVPELLRQARQLLASARHGVPVWIMPLGRVYESFDPRETKFDVVIIDEASQSDVTALAALYLGREHVVVGDKEQVTPDAVGQRVEDVQRLIATDLEGIPNSHLYDGQTSIYDLAETAFGGVVALREHFRCVPEIIQFCNHLSYNLTILPLREPSSAKVYPALVAHRVNGFRDSAGKTNQIEAEAIASLLISCLNDPAYALNDLGQPMTFGVISLLGDEQALLIEEFLRRRIPPERFVKHRLLCGNAAQFQGDERDVVFLSMVDGPPEDGQLVYRGAGPKDLYKKRYNVAVSRARNQLWVLHSLDPLAHLKPGDLRRRLIEHARDPQALLRATDGFGMRTESPFEKLVLQRLLAAGYRVKTQWPVGAYRIDLVVEGSGKPLGVECDGEKWHTPEQLQRDLEREAILQRLGWIFVRIRGSVFFRDPDAAMGPVFAKLDQLGIEPLGMVDPEAHNVTTDGRVEKLRTQAEILRAEWHRERDANAGQAEGTDASPHGVEITNNERRANVIDESAVGTFQHTGSTDARVIDTQARLIARGGLSESSPSKPPQKSSSASNKSVSQPGGPRRGISRGEGVILQHLAEVDTVLHALRCSACGVTGRLGITAEGIMAECTAEGCGRAERIAKHILELLARRLAARCYQPACNGSLTSMQGPYSNYLKCEKCGSNSSWKGLGERLTTG